MICGRRIMTLVQDTKIAEALFILFLAYNKVDIAEIKAYVSRYGVRIPSLNFPYFPGWIAEIPFTNLVFFKFCITVIPIYCKIIQLFPYACLFAFL